MAWIICPLLQRRNICHTLWMIMWYYAKLKTKNQSLHFTFSRKWLIYMIISFVTTIRNKDLLPKKSYTFGRKLSDYTLLIGLSCFSDQFHKWKICFVSNLEKPTNLYLKLSNENHTKFWFCTECFNFIKSIFYILSTIISTWK